MRHAFRFEWAGGVALASVLLLAAVAAGADSAPRYRLAHQVSLPGDEGWDYLTLEPEGHRLFIAPGPHVQVVGTLALDAKPEFAVPDGRGRLYVNLEDRNSLAVLDARKLSVLSVWPIAGCEEPSGLAFDADRRHLFPVCSNRVMAVVDAASGRALGSAPIGAGVDAAAYDPGSGLAFASCGEGNLTVVRTGASGAAQVVQSVPTRRGARTMALDTRTHRVYLVTADFG